MLRETLPAAGNNRDRWPYAGHDGAAWRCTKRHRGLNRDHWPRAGRESYASTPAAGKGTAGCERAGEAA